MRRHAAAHVAALPAPRPLTRAVGPLHWLVLAIVAVFLVVEVVVPTVQWHEPPPTAPSLVEMRMERMLAAGLCWDDEGPHPYAHHAFFLTPSTGLHYGPSGPAFAIVFGPDGVQASGDEAPGLVAAFCR